MRPKFFIPILFFLFSFSANAQQWNWITGSFSSSIVEGHAVCVDQHHNTWATGYFQDSLTLGTLSAYAPHSGIYIAKFDPAGNPLLLIQSDTSVFFADGFGICADLFGNIYVTGQYSGYLIIQNDTLQQVQSNSPDVFLLKFDTTGNILWSRGAYGTASDNGVSVSCDLAGNVFMSGTFESYFFFIGHDTLTCLAPSSVFLSKYDQNGNEIWAKQSYAYDEASGGYSSSDRFGNIYLSGVFKVSIAFGNLTYNAGNPAMGESFLTKFDSSGMEIWLKGKETSHGQVLSRAIAIDLLGHPVICGVFTDSLFLFNVDTLFNMQYGQYRSFVAKYDSSGNELWARGDQSGDAFNSWAVTADNQGNIYYLAGTFNPSQQSFTVEGTTISYSNISFDPGFIASFDPSGNLECVSLMASGTDDLAGMCADPNGSSVMLSGDMEGDTLLFDSTTVYGSGLEYLFAASWSCSVGKNEVDETKKNENLLHLFPNPSSNYIFIEFPGEEKSGALISIFDEEGNYVWKTNYASSPLNGEIKIDISGFSNGIYLCRVETVEGISAKTIFVKSN
jgi:hypothetical protein